MDRLDSDIKKIKLARMCPAEKWLYDIFINVEKNKYDSNTILYRQGLNYIMSYDIDRKTLWCDDKLIWGVLKFDYKLTDIESSHIIIKLAKTYLKLDAIMVGFWV